jgi:micrococcal nuclease
VVDGDTVDVRFPDGSTDTVRLLGIDTPEVHADPEPEEYEGVPDTDAGAACLRDAGEWASIVLTDRIAGEAVRLEFDPAADLRGGYDRLLAYVVHEETNLNYWLVERGHARVYDAEFTSAGDFYAAESAAQTANRGLWNCTSAGETAG